ncbi:DEKNAAC105203 [Brettanomyces naardenensis]|uniref:DEKNAAC105203 n=1 Tax=Brettanomyces naardenensis TaxID=13370 RepID=A0A448YSR7_BRENA|nr:DEKNAAC105203 [Brettanomyces naardenensis]
MRLSVFTTLSCLSTALCQLVSTNGTDFWTYDHCVSILRNETSATEQRQPGVNSIDYSAAHIGSSDISSPQPSRKQWDQSGFELSFTLDYYPEFERQKRDAEYDLLTLSQKHALHSLEFLADRRDDFDSSYLLGQLYLYGNFSVPRNPDKALHYLELATKVTGPAEKFSNAHYLLAFLYSTGLFGEIEQNQGKALLHYTIAADLGHVRAAMCLAYRYYSGFSVEKDEDIALYYYMRVARYCRSFYGAESGGSFLNLGSTNDSRVNDALMFLSPNLESYSVRLSDFNDGLYGAGVSEAVPSVRRQSSFDDDGLDGSLFDDMDADPSEVYLAELYRTYYRHYHGGYFSPVERNYTVAIASARYCAREGFKLPSVKYYRQYDKAERTVEVELTGRCAAAVGHMYLRGEGTPQNFTTARAWLQRASELVQDPQLSADLGLIYQFGLGLDKPNLEKATSIYRSSFNTPAISYQRGRLMMSQNDPLGWRLVSLAAYEHYLPALYAVIQSYEEGNPMGIHRSVALDDAKAFCELFEPAVSDLRWAFSRVAKGDASSAILAYAMAAEAGYETAQGTVGYLLYPPTGYLEQPPRVPLSRFRAALNFYRGSARQGNIDSMVYLGDLYWSGLPNTTVADTNTTFIISPDPEKAVGVYREASNRRSHQASFNLGRAYETGQGVPRDLHLAKRYYDKALAIKPDAYIPVELALLRLKIKTWWFRLMGFESAGSSQEQEGLPRRTWHELLHLYDRLRQRQMSSEINVSIPGVIQAGNNEAADEIRENVNNVPGEAENEEDNNGLSFEFQTEGNLGIEDMIFMGIFLSLLFYTMYARWRAARRRRDNGEEGNEGENANAQNGDAVERPPPIQFNFMVIPL